MTCRRCSECVNATHHWMPNASEIVPGGWFDCKHCSQKGMECRECDGEGCDECDGEGVRPVLFAACPKCGENCECEAEAVDLMREAVEAMVAWFDAEDQNTGTFWGRCDLCKYAEWAARRALGQDVGEYKGIPRLVIQFGADKED